MQWNVTTRWLAIIPVACRNSPRDNTASTGYFKSFGWICALGAVSFTTIALYVSSGGYLTDTSTHLLLFMTKLGRYTHKDESVWIVTGRLFANLNNQHTITLVIVSVQVL